MSGGGVEARRAVYHKADSKGAAVRDAGGFRRVLRARFRAHDDESWDEGIRQNFCWNDFIFPAENVVMKEAMAWMDMGVRARVVEQYRRSRLRKAGWSSR